MLTCKQALPSVISLFPRISQLSPLTPAAMAGEYPTTLAFTQHNVSVKTDKTLNLLLPIIAQPIAQNIVTEAVLGIETIFITDANEASFTASLNGSITNTGPCKLSS